MSPAREASGKMVDPRDAGPEGDPSESPGRSELGSAWRTKGPVCSAKIQLVVCAVG